MQFRNARQPAALNGRESAVTYSGELIKHLYWVQDLRLAERTNDGGMAAAGTHFDYGEILPTLRLED